jgi:hypothetical protein
VTTGLIDALDPFTLPIAAQIAQVVMAGAVVGHVGLLRPAGARADLFLVVDMVHGDLTDDIQTGRLPGADPQVAHLEQALSTMRQLPRRSAGRALLRREIGPGAARGVVDGRVDAGHWWSPREEPSECTLTDWQQNRLARYAGHLDAATFAFLRVMQPWQRLRSGPAPRHFHQAPRPRVLHATSAPRRSSLLHRGQATAAAPAASAASAAQAAPAEPATDSYGAGSPFDLFGSHVQTLVTEVAEAGPLPSDVASAAAPAPAPAPVEAPEPEPAYVYPVSSAFTGPIEIQEFSEPGPPPLPTGPLTFPTFPAPQPQSASSGSNKWSLGFNFTGQVPAQQRDSSDTQPKGLATSSADPAHVPFTSKVSSRVPGRFKSARANRAANDASRSAGPSAAAPGSEFGTTGINDLLPRI